MPNMDLFDREFFGISESDVTFMDPQERLLLESTYEAIVDAGKNCLKIPTHLQSFFVHKLLAQLDDEMFDAIIFSPTLKQNKLRRHRS